MKNPPVFILGSHKSGTSLLRSLLDGHPELYVIPFETHFMASLGRWVQYSYRRQTPHENFEFSEKLLETLKKYSNSKDRQTDAVLSDVIDLKNITDVLKKEKGIKSPKDALQLIGDLMPLLVPEMSDAKGKRVVEKSVEHAEMAMELYHCFPDAHFIHIVKNPYANFVALRKFKSKDQGYPLINRVYDSLENGYFFLDKNKKIIPNYKVLRYEDLARNPKQIMSEISDFLDIKFDKNMLEPSVLSKPWSGNSAYGSINGISSKFIDNWKNEIHPNEANLITKNLSHVLQSYGYEKQTIHKGGWRPAKGESLIRFLYNRFYSFYLR